MVAMFVEIDALPGAQVETAVADGDGYCVAKKHGFDVGGHVVGSFVSVAVVRGVFGNRFVEVALHVLADSRVRVFVEGQGGGCVADEDVGQADVEVAQARDGVFDIAGDEMKTAGFWGEGDLSLVPGHRWSLVGLLVEPIRR